jgi:hypothetical protein
VLISGAILKIDLGEVDETAPELQKEFISWVIDSWKAGECLSVTYKKQFATLKWTKHTS